MHRVRLLAMSALLTGLMGCSIIEDLMGGAALPPEVDASLKEGNLPDADAKVAAFAKENPTHLEGALRQSLLQLMAGDYDGADATLAAAEAGAGEAVGQIKLRRAMVALRRGNHMDAVLEHAKASNTDEGRVLAAEVHIVDLNPEAAKPLLQKASAAPGPVGETAKKYLDMLAQGSVQEGLAEVTALWALGDRATACDLVTDVISEMEDGNEKATLQLLWASRALSSKKVGVAEALVSEMLEIPSQEQAWRVQATKALIAIAQGEYERGLEMLEVLEKGAPADGLADARATACALASHPEVAVRIAGDLKSNPIAWCLYKAGALDEAKKHVVKGTPMADFLENQ